MEWKYYWRNIVKRYSVIIEGWPHHIPFKNFSEVSNTYADLELLLCKWRSGEIRWKILTVAELEKEESKRNAGLENGELHEPTPRCQQSDCGKKRKRPSDQQAHNGDTPEQGGGQQDNADDRPYRTCQKRAQRHKGEGDERDDGRGSDQQHDVDDHPYDTCQKCAQRHRGEGGEQDDGRGMVNSRKGKKAAISEEYVESSGESEGDIDSD
jgi:hypothetical protein